MSENPTLTPNYAETRSRCDDTRSAMNCFLISLLALACAFTLRAEGANAAKETVLYSFQNNGTDGMAPYASVTHMNGKLYGTTAYGGTGSCMRAPPYGCGTVFFVDPSTGAETVIYSFQNNGSDGSFPVGLTKVGSHLYGITALGGTIGCGTVFSLDPISGNETVLHSFQGGSDGCGPIAALIDVKGILYGTTCCGGAEEEGTVFSINPQTNAEAVLYSFCREEYCSDGNYPGSSLLTVMGKLYGTTNSGGTYNGGTVFSFDPGAGVETVLHSFGNGTDGYGPEDALIDVNGTLYGTTDGGGGGSGCQDHGCGTLFSLKLAPEKEAVLYSFEGAQNGAQPMASLLAVDSKLYGTTADGGGFACEGGCGMVFSFDLKSGGETVLYSFHDYGGDGANPVAGLIEVNGMLYGTTVNGGTAGYGTVFKVKP